jgi:hypothetical protein
MLFPALRRDLVVFDGQGRPMVRLTCCLYRPAVPLVEESVQVWHGPKRRPHGRLRLHPV